MRIHLMLTPLVMAVALVGCNKDEERLDEPAGKAIDRPEQTAPSDIDDPGVPSTPDQPEDNREQIDSDGELDAMRRQWVESTRDSVDALEKKSAEARRELEEAGEASKEQARETLDDLDAQRRRLNEELGKADERSGDQWDEFKRDIDEASEELEQSYNRVLEDLKSDNN